MRGGSLWVAGALAALAPVSGFAAESGSMTAGGLLLAGGVGVAFGAAFGAAVAFLSHRAAAARRARRDRRQWALETALDTVTSGLVALDDRGRIELANAAARRMLGLPRAARRGERWPVGARFRATDGDDAAMETPLALLMRGERVRSAEYLLAIGEGREFRVRINGEPAPADGPIGAVMTLEDITEQHRARILGDRAERLDALGKLTGGVAHDFNNLLSTIMGAVQLAQRRAGDDPRIARHLDAALRATRTGADLVDRLLGFAKRGAATVETVSVETLFAELAPLAENAVGPSMRLSFTPPPPGAAVRCDRAQIVTALLNLVANARDAIDGAERRGAITITATLSAELPGHHEIAVSDDGPGMAPEVRARALDPFFTTKGAARGTGLGLSMVYGAARRCGGDLRIDSTPGAGATVRLLLPSAAPAAAVETPAERIETVGAGRAVLLVEDEPDLLATAQELLTEIGYAVMPARNAAEALRTLERGHVVEALVTDVVMPGGLSGVELALAARRMRPGLPVVLASGYADAALATAPRLDAPMIRKPYELEQLAEAVRQAVASREESRSTPGRLRAVS
jgi:PAS domain S-box-containing protein